MVSSRAIQQFAVILASITSVVADGKVYVGCYSSGSGLTNANVDGTYLTEDTCLTTCVTAKGNQAVLGLANKGECWCGNQVPPTAQKVADSQCSYGCNGFGPHPCGGPGGLFTVYLTGTQATVQAVGGGTVSTSGGSALPGTSSGTSSSSSTSSSTSATPSAATTVVAPGQTVTTTATPNTSAAPAAQGSSVNVGAVAGGVVVGIVVLFAIIGAVFFIRRRKRRAAEEAHTTSAANFVAGGYKSNGMSGPRGPDSRFDSEAMAHRRMSDGSIADNEDYSRRILKVTNA